MDITGIGSIFDFGSKVIDKASRLKAAMALVLYAHP